MRHDAECRGGDDAGRDNKRSAPGCRAADFAMQTAAAVRGDAGGNDLTALVLGTGRRHRVGDACARHDVDDGTVASGVLQRFRQGPARSGRAFAARRLAKGLGEPGDEKCVAGSGRCTWRAWLQTTVFAQPRGADGLLRDAAGTLLTGHTLATKRETEDPVLVDGR